MKIIPFLIVSLAFLQPAQAQTNCNTCSENVKATLANDALLKQYNAAGGQASSYRAMYRTLDITLKMCGECMSAIERDAAKEAMQQMKEMIVSLKSDVPVFKDDPNFFKNRPPVTNDNQNDNTPASKGQIRNVGESGHVD